MNKLTMWARPLTCMWVVAACVMSAATMHAEGQSAGHGVFTPAEIAWKEGPASLPAGAQVAVLEGNPAEPGPFTLRLKFPDGYRVAPHWHPAIERVTVVAGTFHLGMGEIFDQARARTLQQCARHAEQWNAPWPLSLNVGRLSLQDAVREQASKSSILKP